MRTIYKSDGEMYDTPAAVDRETGIMYINPKLWFKLTPFQRKFVKLHEQGHYFLQTDLEEEADAYAFDKLAGTEYRSMKQCIETLETILNPNRTGHKVRINALIQRAIEWDKKHPQKLSKGSGSSSSGSSDNSSAYVSVIEAVNKGNSDLLSTVMSKEQNSDNNRTMVYCMLAICALFIFKD